MKSYAPRLFIACLAFGLTSVSIAAPGWVKRAGVDFWNFDREKSRLGAADGEARRLEAVRERQAARIAASDRLASELCACRITLDEALDELAAAVQDDRDWFAALRDDYRLHGELPEAAADRDVMACYLRNKIAGRQWDADPSGGPAGLQ